MFACLHGKVLHPVGRAVARLPRNGARRITFLLYPLAMAHRHEGETAPEIPLASMVKGVLTSLYTRPGYCVPFSVWVPAVPPERGLPGGKNGTAVPGGHHCCQHVHAGLDGAADSSVHAIRPPQLAASFVTDPFLHHSSILWGFLHRRPKAKGRFLRTVQTSSINPIRPYS